MCRAQATKDEKMSACVQNADPIGYIRAKRTLALTRKMISFDR
jgi:hypothetical protein